MRTRSYRLLFAASFGLALVSAPISASAAWWSPSSLASTGATTADRLFVPVQLAQGSAERFNRIESQMRTLTGQVEELTYQLRQLQDQLARMQEDNEFRFRDLEGGGSGGASRKQSAAPETPPAGAAATSVPVLPPPGQQDSVGAIAGAPPIPPTPPAAGGPGAPPQPLGTLTLDAPAPSGGANQPIDLTRPPSQPGAELAAVAPTGNPRTDYDRAYNSILNGDYGTAELAFRQFLSAYPDDALAPDAQYWLGESLFVRAQFREAANAFLAGYKSYPKSAKAPDALLKLGLSLSGLGEREAACRTFDAVLKQYPDASNALRQRVKFEQSSASC
jgi:tol-pal system protein YbgF